MSEALFIAANHSKDEKEKVISKLESIIRLLEKLGDRGA